MTKGYHTYIIGFVLICLILVGCGSTPQLPVTPGQDQSAKQKESKQIEAEGDVTTKSEQTSKQEQEESGAETGQVSGDVSQETTRYGLDSGMASILSETLNLLSTPITDMAKLATKLIGSFVSIGIGLMILLVFVRVDYSIGALTGVGVMVFGTLLSFGLL